MPDTIPDLCGRLGPDAAPLTEAFVKLAALPGAFANRAGCDTEGGRGGLDLGSQDLGCADLVHGGNHNVIYHTSQAERSHSRAVSRPAKVYLMKENDIFRRNPLAAMNEAKLSAAALSRKAGMNARLVTDIAEGRSASPKMSTVFALSKALGKDPGEMMGLGPRPHLHAELVRFLERYGEDDQARILEALRALPLLPRE